MGSIRNLFCSIIFLKLKKNLKSFGAGMKHKTWASGREKKKTYVYNLRCLKTVLHPPEQHKHTQVKLKTGGPHSRGQNGGSSGYSIASWGTFSPLEIK